MATFTPCTVEFFSGLGRVKAFHQGETLFKHSNGRDARESFTRSQQVVNKRAWTGDEGHGAVSMSDHAVQREVR